MIDPALFGGPWVGETIGCDTPAHMWEITLFGAYLSIDTRWEGFTQRELLSGKLIEDQPAFSVDGYSRLAEVVDSQHFVIAGWDSKHAKTSKPALDVVFSRPGVAALLAHNVYRHYLDQKMRQP